MTWVASRPLDAMKKIQEGAPARLALHKSIQDMGQNNVDPTAPEVQALEVRENEITVQYGMRDFAASMFEWNGPLAQKWLDMGDRIRARASESATPDGELVAYFRAVQAASPWHRALGPAADEAAELADKKTAPAAEPAQALAGRLRQICADHALGDPLVYVRWARAMQYRWPDEDIARKQAGWTFLANALEATAKH
jgi:hypothetical protein